MRRLLAALSVTLLAASILAALPLEAQQKKCKMGEGRGNRVVCK